MAEEPICQSCGATLGSGMPEGLCPVCLLGAGLGGEVEEEPDEVSFIEEQPGDLVGNYRLVEKAGEGGFGVVFRAEQDKPVKRVVALKVIKPGMDSKEVVMRFEAERQALAVMDHPGIARIHDAGTTVHGRPYFIMEYVEGRPLTEFCDAQKLDLRERLALFVQVCDAVQHAHQKGVIHRDLKPGNILVSAEGDAVPFPKIIDFGVAKAISIELTEKTFFTVFGRLVGTPQYMSPEQAQLNAVDVDTRSDIYSLGVLLYELVTGRAPLEDRELTSVGYDEMRRMIREVEPPKPSSRVGSLPDHELRALASTRGMDPARYRRHLRGDLDWITMKALEKNRDRRYGSANGLGADVKDYLKGLPVVAGPPGAAYRVRKFVQRNRAATLAGALLVVGGIVLATVVTIHFDHLRNRAEFRRLEELVRSVVSSSYDQPGTRGDAIENLKEVGFADLKDLELTEDEARGLRQDARNELIACLAWTDLQSRPLLADATNDEELPDDWVPAALDPDHRNCLLGFADGRLELREVGSGKILRTWPGSGEPVASVEISSDGRRAAARVGASEPWDRVLWNLDTPGTSIHAVKGVREGFDFRPHHEGFAVVDSAGTLKLFEKPGGKHTVLQLPSGDPKVLRFSPDGHHLAAGLEPDGVVLIGLNEQDLVQAWDGLDAASLAWAPDNQSIAVGRMDGSITMLRTSSKEPVFESAPQHQNPVRQIAWSDDGLLVASGSSGSVDEVRLWDGRQGTLLCKYPTLARSLTFSKDSRFLGPVLSTPRVLSTLKVDRAPVCHRAEGHRGAKTIVAASWRGARPDGLILATAAGDGLRFWNQEGTALKHLPAVKVRKDGLAWAGSHLYLATPTGISRCKVRVEAGRFHCGDVEPWSKGIADAGQIAFGPKEQFLAVACPDQVLLLDPATGLELGSFPALDSTTSVAASPDGKWLAAGTSNTGVRIWRMSDGKHWDLPLEGAATVAFYPLPFDPTSRSRAPLSLLMTGDRENYRNWKWNAESKSWEEDGKPHKSEMSMSNPEGRRPRMALSPRGTATVISYDRRYLRILNPLSLEEIAQPGFLEQWPLAFGPAGRMMATAAENGRIYIWNLEQVRIELGTRGLDWTKADDGVNLPPVPFDSPIPPLVLP